MGFLHHQKLQVIGAGFGRSGTTSLRAALRLVTWLVPALFVAEMLWAGLRANALNLSEGLKDASSRVTFELALLQAEIVEGKADTATVVHRLSGMDALMVGALASMADVVDELEKAAERDEANERAFVPVIEATGVLLQGLEQAKSATPALSAATSTR